MAAVTTTNCNYQHFTATSGDTVTFTRGINSLIVTAPTGSSLTVTFDGQSGSMAVAVGTHQFFNLSIKTLTVGGTGTMTGTGICI